MKRLFGSKKRRQRWRWMSEYTFRKMTRDDYPMFEHWLNQPHIDGWWDSAGVELRLIEEERARAEATAALREQEASLLRFHNIDQFITNLRHCRNICRLH